MIVQTYIRDNGKGEIFDCNQKLQSKNIIAILYQYEIENNNIIIFSNFNLQFILFLPP